MYMCNRVYVLFRFFFFQAEDGIRDLVRSRGLGDVYKRQEESIAYGMPAYKTVGNPLVYFAAFKKHIGFYATPSGHEQLSLIHI